MFRKILFLFFLLIFSSAYAQTLIKGRVLDKATGLPLPGATLFLPELNKAIISDEAGTFSVSVPFKGRLMIEVSFLGYQSIAQTLELIPNETVCDFSLRRSSIEVDEVTISGSHRVSQNESPQEIDVLKLNTPEQADAPVLTDALAKIPGVTILSTGAYIARPIIRGLGGNRILTVSDEIRLENQQWDEEHGLGQTDIGLDKVEVIKGPSSVLYGPEAMGGVVHLIEEAPAPVGHVLGDVFLSTFSNGLGFQGGVGLKGATEKWNWKLNGGGKSFSDFYSGIGARVPNSRMGQGNFKAEAGITRNWGSTSLHYQFDEAFFGIVETNDREAKAGGEEEEEFPREAEAPYHEVTYHRLSSHSTFLLGSTRLKTIIGYQDDHRLEQEGDSVNKLGHPYIEMHLSTVTYDLKWYMPLLKRWSLVLGGQGMMQQNENLLLTRIIPDATTKDLGGLALLKYNFRDLALSVGGRYDTRSISTQQSGMVDSSWFLPAISRNYGNFTFTAGGSYDLFDKLVFRLNGASGYRAPNLAELLSNGVKLETQRFEKGNTNFVAEKNVEMDASLRLNLPVVSLEASLFNNKVNDFIYLQPTSIVKSEGYQEYDYQQGNVQMNGGEGGVEVSLMNNRLLLESKLSVVRAKLTGGGYLPFIPSDRIRSSITFRLRDWKQFHNGYISLSLVDVMAQSRAAFNEFSTAAYDLIGFNIGSTLKVKKLSFDISLFGNNLTDQKYFDPLSRLKPSVVNPLGVPGIGRNIGIMIRMPLVLK